MTQRKKNFRSIISANPPVIPITSESDRFLILFQNFLKKKTKEAITSCRAVVSPCA